MTRNLTRNSKKARGVWDREERASWEEGERESEREGEREAHYIRN